MRFPTVIEAGDAESRLVYERARDHFAVKGDAPPALSARIVARIENEPPLSVCVGDAPPADGRAEPGTLLPVYRLVPNGPLFVPTGSIFARFRDGTVAAEQADVLAAAGFRVASAPAYAPNAAWLEAGDGDMAAALAGIGRLGAVPGLVRIEPQMLSPAARRAS